jgi:hypothetical protein
MPHISNKRLHTAAYMLRALSRAGQFAHLPVRWIEQDLALLYKQHAHREWSDYARQAVSEDVYRLHRAGVIPKMYSAAGTLQFFSIRYGSLCALCRSTSCDCGWGSPRLSFFIAPTYLHVQDGNLTGMICRQCSSNLPSLPSYDNRDAIAASLAVLITRKAFLRREQENRNRWLRFDPCRIGLKGELARFNHDKPYRKVSLRSAMTEHRRRLAAGRAASANLQPGRSLDDVSAT